MRVVFEILALGGSFAGGHAFPTVRFYFTVVLLLTPVLLQECWPHLATLTALGTEAASLAKMNACSRFCIRHLASFLV